LLHVYVPGESSFSVESAWSVHVFVMRGLYDGYIG